MSVPAARGIAAAALLSAAAFLAGDLFASCAATMGGDPVSALSQAARALPAFALSRALAPDLSPLPLSVGVTCACGSHRWSMKVRHAAVDLICQDCGAVLRIPAASDADLDDLCCRMKLVIPSRAQ